jgi:hypothetical protein
MSGVAISLGGVVLQDFEVPERVIISGGQRLAIHQLIGGGRIIDALGDDPGDIEFAGAFSGEDAAIRAQLLDAATTLGAEIPLYWDSFFYTVVIRNYQVNFEKPWWMPFRLRCAILINPEAAIAGLVNAATNLIAVDISAALSLSPQAGLSLGLSGTPSVTGLSAAQSAASEAFSATDQSFADEVSSLGAVVDAASAGAIVSGLVATNGQLAALSNIGFYLQRVSTNMLNELV